MIVNDLPLETNFEYKLRTYKVIRKEEYPFVICRCIEGPEESLGEEIVFANLEDVDPIWGRTRCPITEGGLI